MSDAPERIYMDPDVKFPECEKQYACDVEYVRADRIEELEKACKEWSEVSQSNYQRAKAAEEKLAEMQVVGDAMAASIEGNYYVAGIAKMWRTIAKIKSQGDEFAMQKGEQP